MKRIILFTGKAGCGKDTACDYLVSRGMAKMAFADPIYEITKIAFNLTEEYVRNRDNKEITIPGFDVTLREALQKIGTEMFRDMIDQQIWVKNMISRIENSVCPETNTVAIAISDLRFPNERTMVDTLEQMGYDVLVIKLTQKGRDGKVGIKSHKSESYDIQADVCLTNDGLFIELFDKLDASCF
jgi:hypothetical protein